MKDILIQLNMQESLINDFYDQITQEAKSFVGQPNNADGYARPSDLHHYYNSSLIYSHFLRICAL